MPPLVAAGAIALERAAHRPRLGWLMPTATAGIALVGLASAPMTLPLLPPTDLVELTTALGLGAPRMEDRGVGALDPHFADMFGWEEIVDTVAEVYAALPPEERARAVVVAVSYARPEPSTGWGPHAGCPERSALTTATGSGHRRCRRLGRGHCRRSARALGAALEHDRGSGGMGLRLLPSGAEPLEGLRRAEPAGAHGRDLGGAASLRLSVVAVDGMREPHANQASSARSTAAAPTQERGRSPRRGGTAPDRARRKAMGVRTRCAPRSSGDPRPDRRWPLRAASRSPPLGSGRAASPASRAWSRASRRRTPRTGITRAPTAIATVPARSSNPPLPVSNESSCSDETAT